MKDTITHRELLDWLVDRATAAHAAEMAAFNAYNTVSCPDPDAAREAYQQARAARQAIDGLMRATPTAFTAAQEATR